MQGAFREHVDAFRRCGCEAMEVRTREELDEVAALAIPGGESTAITKLLRSFGLWEALLKRGAEDLPILATCAGVIVLARGIVGSDQVSLGLLDVAVRRNAYGRQVDSFETELKIEALGTEPVPAIFIRAPIIESVGPKVEVLATYREKAVLVRQGRILAATFHPELTADLRLHQYFLEMAEGKR
ncbi:glutamine amidotransferase PdxT [Thermacetogenium phaeum DSM 12270]|uniref:Pyridoxal 5'-phosphate synthase subunit PdxT n=2 Tax=Thermacetogenium phaeum TaxID=85874 RepID=K4LQD2_THEPS|nr:glutamine amidotransferase PdxT [Thermacetogenium phaeum DSM 12270]